MWIKLSLFDGFRQIFSSSSHIRQVTTVMLPECERQTFCPQLLQIYGNFSSTFCRIQVRQEIDQDS